MSELKTVLSAIQPTGDIHIGNYFGAVQNWTLLQEQYRCRFGVVDFHAQTMPFDPIKLRENSWSMVYQLLACGVKPEVLFVQSLVPEHTELGWILSCIGSYGELTRMTQFKDKSDQINDQSKDSFVSVGLFTYPVLQAADILIYRAHYVPVGKDQVQHLELSRNIAQRFNTLFGKEYFPLPEALLTSSPKILSPADPTKKMSKSLGPKHYLPIFGDVGAMKKQIKSAVTDAGGTAPGELSPGVENLLLLLKLSGDQIGYEAMIEQQEEGTLRYGDLKALTANGLETLLTPMNERLAEIHSEKTKYQDMVRESSAEIRKHATETLREVKEMTGLLNPKI
jgi:tryptophanyl-tRNA synthetase